MEFQSAGPYDSKGRSLRELDLRGRLLKYSCSFLIYSPAFDALPSAMKNYLWGRLAQVLSAKDHTRAYAAMSALDRQNVFEILRDTKPEFAAWLQEQSTVAKQ